jgi:hypothetical protein
MAKASKRPAAKRKTASPKAAPRKPASQKTKATTSAAPMAKPPRATPVELVKTATPDFEVKLFLDAAKVLDVEFKPVADVSRELDLRPSNRKISMQFLDARPPAIHAEGWSVRVRKFEDDDKFELSYKRRYPIGQGDLPDALFIAAEHGFHAGEGDYAPQVEWGYDKRTLSFTRKKEFKAKNCPGMSLPSLEAVREAAIAGLPGKLDRWKRDGWARGILEKSDLYGAVLGKRWSGKWHGPALSLEVWLIRTESGQGYEPVVELSFKEKEEAAADDFRTKLMALARKFNVLLERDVLKTEMILTRY